jgi:16S rRNA (cytidine1402-2'-O)-methyltransferase
LFVVATPIGNLEDVTLRAVRVLREVEAILAEDTRRTRTLCTAHGIGTPLRAFHAHSGEGAVEKLVAELAAGARFALVTDAGTPVVSDPGARLVAAARDAGIAVEVIPGPSAVTAAIAACGLRVDGFRFAGFLPRGGARRREAIEAIARAGEASVVFEAPSRTGDTLAELAVACGAERSAAVCRELTKVHEEVVRGTLGSLAAQFAGGARGEVTLVIEGAGAPAEEAVLDEAAIEERVREWLAAGATARDVAERVASELGLSRSEAKQRVFRIAGSTRDP